VGEHSGIDKPDIKFESCVIGRVLVVRDVMLLFPVLFSDVVIAQRVTDQVTVVVRIIHSFIAARR
jgi:hypothetical protein